MLGEEVIVDAAHRPGQLGRMFRTLSRARIDVLGVAAQSSPWEEKRPRKRVRFTLSDPQAGAAVLKKEGFSVKVVESLVFAVDHPVLHLEVAMDRLAQSGLNIEALYYAKLHREPHVVLAIDDAREAFDLLGLSAPVHDGLVRA